MQVIKCQNCGFENIIDSYKCEQCYVILRERQPYIDFWNSIYKLSFETSDTFRKLICSEQKNYLILLILLFNLKTSYLIFIFGNAHDHTVTFKEFYTLYLYLFIFTNCIYLFQLLGNSFLKYFKNRKIKILNLMTVNVYSYSIYSLSGLFLIPVQMLFFGPYLFSNNPSAYQIKPAIFIFFFALETIIIIYSVLLDITGIKVYLNNKKLAVIISILKSAFLVLVFYNSEYLLKFIIKHLFLKS